MNLINLFRVAFNSLRRNKLRTFLTMLGVIIGVASVIAMIAIGQGSKQSIKDEISELGTNLIMIMPGADRRGGVNFGHSSSQKLSVKDVESIQQQCQYVSYVTPIVTSKGQCIVGVNNWPSTVYGVNQNFLDIKNWPLESGQNITLEDIKKSRKVCLLGQTVVEELFGEGANPVGENIRFNKTPFKIIGVLESKGSNNFGMDQDDIIISPYTTVQKRILAINYINSINASAISEDVSSEAEEEITYILRHNHKLKTEDDDDFHIRTQEEILSMMGSMSSTMTTLLAAIASISLLVGGIGIMNIMYVSIIERTKEIGLRTAIGGKGKDILFQFIIESILISVIGGILGIFLGLLASFIVSHFMGWLVVVTIKSIVLAFFVSTIIGVFFGWYPAKKAANLNPIDALRYE